MTENSPKNPLLDSQDNRREFVKKAGKLALYTTPALVLLMQPKTEAIAGSPGRPRNGYKPFKKFKFPKRRNNRNGQIPF